MVANLPENAFNAVAVVRAHFPATIVTALVGDHVIVLIGPREEGDAASEVPRDCRIAVVHPPFVLALLDRNNHTVVDASQMFHPMCVSHG